MVIWRCGKVLEWLGLTCIGNRGGKACIDRDDLLLLELVQYRAWMSLRLTYEHDLIHALAFTDLEVDLRIGTYSV